MPHRPPAAVLTLGIAALIPLIALVGGLSGCGESHAAGGPGGPPPISAAPATARNLAPFEDFTGRLEATESVDVRAQVPGTLERVHFREGQLVRRGELLFTLDARPFAAEVARAEAAVTTARTQADLAASELARAERLVPLQAISQQEVDLLRAQARSGAASVASAQATLRTAQINLGYTQIRSPIAGRVSRANVTAGNLVGVPEPVLTTVVSTDRVHAYFDASEATYLALLKNVRPGGSGGAAPAVQMGLANEEGLPHRGTVDFVDNRLSPTTGTIRARATFDNKAGTFTPGLFARLRLVGNTPAPAVLVPDRAIGTDQTQKFVLVVGADGKAQFRPVRPGVLLDGMRVVTGVKAGENVIVDGLQRVQPGMPVQAQVLKVDERGMPLPPPPAAPPAAAGGKS